jgi:flagellar M-ring protein FliF
MRFPGWDELSIAARSTLVVGAALIVLALGLGSYWVLREDMQVLFAELNPEDAAAMVAELDRMKVPYALDDNGTTIKVERELVYKTRLKLMGKGLDLHGTVGLELFNNADMGMTEFAQKVNYQRALQGELARTIMGFDEVKIARVHLVLPESGLYKRQKAKPKASISLVLKGASVLSQEQISGIQRLVAASVPEIDPMSVTVLDHRGVAVSKASTDNGDIVDPVGRLDTKKQIEDYLTRKVVGVMDKAVGPGKAIVSIDVAINYDELKVTKEDVTPLPSTSGQDVGAVARRRQTTQGLETVGDLAASVFSDGTQNRPTTGSASPMSTTADIEYINGRRIEHLVAAPGSIRRLSVGVMVPDVSDPAELEKLKEMVSMAVGITPSRGDAIVVYPVVPPAPSPPVMDGADAAQSPTAPRSEEPQQDSRVSPTFLRGREHLLLSVLLGAFLSMLIGLWWVGRRRSTAKTVPAMTSADRTKLLAEVTSWANAQRR